MNKRIVPRTGLVVRRPDTGEILPPGGEVVPFGPHRAYWLRRKKDGDVEILDSQGVSAPAASKSTSKKEAE
ncbi:DUF2635 domain-containing protein [uncultured Desulfovibrio sp.]|uniref:DUF2635 domain-containing protein n=1 Tax=uncultured Desulfovibrio sp. TaxID=167968 RepID=UPI0003A8AC05|nr:DUF2635 domain-containing protein [uncultured Desulfovibrio sp.]